MSNRSLENDNAGLAPGKVGKAEISNLNPAQPQVTGLDSTGRCNRLAKSFSGRFVV
jgi:hypothetical protein